MELKKRLAIGMLFIFIGGLVTFYTIFYSFWFTLQVLGVVCLVPSTFTPETFSTVFTIPLILMGLYVTLVTAIIYYVNPFTKE